MKLFVVVVVVLSVFVLGGDGGPVSFGVGCETVRRRRRRRRLFLFWGDGGQSASSVWLAQRLTPVRKCALSGRDFVRKGFCQEGILSGRNPVRQGFCHEAGSARKRALPGRRVSFGVCLLWGGTV